MAPVSDIRVTMIAAADLDNCIGADGDLPWHLPADLRMFQKLTDGHVCIAGSRTQRSIVERIGKPLPERITVVVSSRETASYPGVVYVTDPTIAVETAATIERFAGRDEIFVIGGGQIYNALLPFVEHVYLTRVAAHVHGDTHLTRNWYHNFQMIGSRPLERSERDKYTASVEVYERRT